MLDLGLKIGKDKYTTPGTEGYGIIVKGLKGGDRRLTLADLVCAAEHRAVLG